ncbi:unnamed protein product [Cylindrotheca closterium]|uniref:SET domain-containing protein n=1 Tax=Cylindrotheca closterium TaxID=2856 RepID=A0AAD2FS56_9STRA|nr:unnamed protein product [Cylindrotheca closterium]
MTIIDPKDLSNLYFGANKKTNAGEETAEFFVHPSIAIQSGTESTTPSDHHGTNIVHGRGMVATNDIAAGECIFITPPTVGMDCHAMESKFKSGTNVALEDLAMEELIDKMMKDINSKQDGDTKVNACINSFLCLMGSTKDTKKKVTIQMLNGKDDTDHWSAEELKDLSRKDMKTILLKNAFGPDFIMYDRIQAQWSSNLSYTPPNILGVFPLAAMINHSCTPNAVRTFSNSCMVAHACQTIPAGKEIMWSYIPPTQVMADRRRALKKRHGFLCKCERCMIEAKELRKDLLPTNLKQALEEANKWNEGMLDMSQISDETSKRQLCAAAIHLEETIFSSKSLSNEVKRHVRVGYTNLHINYFNTMLTTAANRKQPQQQQNVQDLVLQSATQLHFAYCSSNNTSTEHLSVLHLCYELASSSKNNNNNAKFWTEAIKRAHLTRYGSLGSNLTSIRNCMVHTRTVLRQRDGYLQVQFNFL